MPSSGPGSVFGVRSRFIRAALSQMPARCSSGAASSTVTLPMPGAAQRKGERAAGLPAADDGDVVVDARAVRHPVGRIGTNQTKRRASIGVWVR